MTVTDVVLVFALVLAGATLSWVIAGLLLDTLREKEEDADHDY